MEQVHTKCISASSLDNTVNLLFPIFFHEHLYERPSRSCKTRPQESVSPEDVREVKEPEICILTGRLAKTHLNHVEHPNSMIKVPFSTISIADEGTKGKVACNRTLPGSCLPPQCVALYALDQI